MLTHTQVLLTRISCLTLSLGWLALIRVLLTPCACKGPLPKHGRKGFECGSIVSSVSVEHSHVKSSERSSAWTSTTSYNVTLHCRVCETCNMSQTNRSNMLHRTKKRGPLWTEHGTQWIALSVESCCPSNETLPKMLGWLGAAWTSRTNQEALCQK